MVVVFGLRATELTSRKVQDIDDDCHELIITESKTLSGVRRIRLPDVLRILVLRHIEGRSQNQDLFDDANRHWLFRQVKRLCEEAKVPRLTPASWVPRQPCRRGRHVR